MNTLICMVGFPRSGKSSWAKEQGLPIVSPDSLRKVLYGQRFWQPGEKMVWTVAHYMVRALFDAGTETIILDATNLSRNERDQWKSSQWETKFKHISTSEEVCKQRAIETDMADLIPVIERMAMYFESLEEDEGLL